MEINITAIAIIIILITALFYIIYIKNRKDKKDLEKTIQNDFKKLHDENTRSQKGTPEYPEI